MIPMLILAAAVALLYADKIKAWYAANSGKFAQVDRRHVVAAALVAVAIGWWAYGQRPIDDGRPTPAPGSVGELDLTGLFTGPTAAEDALALSQLCDELAAKVEYDAMRDKPRLTTGWQIADLRSAARDYRLAGDTFGNRQPKVRDAVATYLDRPEVLGKNGGPLGPKDRARWIAAFRDIARAAEAAIR